MLVQWSYKLSLFEKDKFSAAVFFFHQPKTICPLSLLSLFVKGRGHVLKVTATRTQNHKNGTLQESATQRWISRSSQFFFTSSLQHWQLICILLLSWNIIWPEYLRETEKPEKNSVQVLLRKESIVSYSSECISAF